jgi:hypothetical protein
MTTPTPHLDPADYVGPHDEDPQHAAHVPVPHLEEPATDPEEYLGPHEEHEGHDPSPQSEEHTVHEKASDLVHHLEDAMHELEERRRLLTGEDPTPLPD